MEYAEPVVAQPLPVPRNIYGDVVPGEDGGPVQVRNMVVEDAEFAGTMFVEAFRDKVEWAVGKSK